MNPNVITAQTPAPLPFGSKVTQDFENIAAARSKRARKCKHRLWLRSRGAYGRTP